MRQLSFFCMVRFSANVNNIILMFHISTISEGLTKRGLTKRYEDESLLKDVE